MVILGVYRVRISQQETASCLYVCNKVQHINEWHTFIDFFSSSATLWTECALSIVIRGGRQYEHCSMTPFAFHSPLLSQKHANAFSIGWNKEYALNRTQQILWLPLKYTDSITELILVWKRRRKNARTFNYVSKIEQVREKQFRIVYVEAIQLVNYRDLSWVVSEFHLTTHTNKNSNNKNGRR